MEPTVQQDIKDVLAQVLKALRDDDPTAMLELSNHTIHDASIFQDEDSISFAVLVYALSKTIQRCKEALCSYGQFVAPLQRAHEAIVAGDIQKYQKCIIQVLNEIRKSDQKTSIYIQEVLDKARIKKGSKLHEHGISIARTAELLGISQWELANYVGKTTVTDSIGKTVTERAAFARSLFT